VGTNLDVGGSKFGFLGENGVKIVTTGENSLLAKAVWNIFAISQNFAISEIAQ